MTRRRGKFSFEGQFSGRLVEMLASAAYRVLSRAALLALTCIEIEFAAHGGTKGGMNGKLICTFENFRKYGVHKDSIAVAIRELVALGFVRITQQGVGGNSDFRRPTLYRLTFFPTKDDAATHDWRSIRDREAGQVVDEMDKHEAEQIDKKNLKYAEQVAMRARKGVDPRAVARSKKQIPAPGFCPVLPPVSGGGNTESSPPVSGGRGSTRKPGVLSRYRAGGRDGDGCGEDGSGAVLDRPFGPPDAEAPSSQSPNSAQTARSTAVPLSTPIVEL